MKPILFNPEMVHAILEDRKTTTRRVMKPQPVEVTTPNGVSYLSWKGMDFFNHSLSKYGPYRPGDILYVQETWTSQSRTCGTIPRILYKADRYTDEEKIKWHPSIHMPREAARIFLRVTGVRVERLQDITDDGIVRDFGFCAEALKIMNAQQKNVACMALWDSTIKKADRDLYGWDANSWVWVIKFERCEKPEGA